MKILFSFLFVVCILTYQLKAQEFNGLTSSIVDDFIYDDNKEIDELIHFFSKLIRANKIAAYHEDYANFNYSVSPKPLSTKEFDKIIKSNGVDTIQQIDPITLEESFLVVKKEHNIEKITIKMNTYFDEKTHKMTSTISRLDFFVPAFRLEDNILKNYGYEMLFYIKFE